MDTWMPLPMPPLEKQAKKQRVKMSAPPNATRSVSTVSASCSAPGGRRDRDPQVSKALNNLDSRLRAVESISFDCVAIPSTTPETCALISAGPAYQQAFSSVGRGHGLGPPHVHTVSSLTKALAASPPDR
eukprot:TRINITY_DN64069_c0_g1_i1.p1 TRINITY_DN64069_c0_g1~~TRINITY_DN64069_c0_g1_i1.p1  ORF type:complete len:130 (+),score=10.79 TRINITY_DN64069_c0_g1_i1:112-501(+)